MNRKKIDTAKAEAHRLLNRIDTLERCAGWQRGKEGEYADLTLPHPGDWFNPGEHTAAVKRASMDLTRALADLRR